MRGSVSPSTRQKPCRQCGTPFTPKNSLQAACGLECALQIARTNRHKEEAARIRKQEKANRKRQREERERVKTTSELTREAQTAFNSYIRARDRGKPCVSCGITYGQFHAGHYRTTKAASQLRFHTANCHSQCAQCNNSKSGNIVEYRKELVSRIGEDKVQWLENNQSVVRYDRDYLRRLKKIFRRRARHIDKLRQL